MTGGVVSWTGWHFDNIGSGHQAAVEVTRVVPDGSIDHLLFLVDYDEFVPYAGEGDIIEVTGSLRVLRMRELKSEAVVVADSFRIKSLQ